MPTCAKCDAYVASDFIRVFGINSEVHGCPTCTTYRELHGGEAVDQQGDLS